MLKSVSFRAPRTRKSAEAPVDRRVRTQKRIRSADLTCHPRSVKTIARINRLHLESDGMEAGGKTTDNAQKSLLIHLQRQRPLWTSMLWASFQ